MRIKVLICTVLEILLAFDNSTDITTAVMPADTSWDTANAATTTTSATTTTEPTTTEPTTTTQKVITIRDEMEKIENHRG